MAFIRTAAYEEAAEGIKEGCDAILRHNFNVPNVHAVSGIRSDTIGSLAAHARAVMESRSGLTLAEKEMIATVASAVNRSQYLAAANTGSLNKQAPAVW